MNDPSKIGCGDSPAKAMQAVPAPADEATQPFFDPDSTHPGTAVSRIDGTAGYPPGTQFGDYKIVRELARGGMGVVFLARQVSLNRQVALKMVQSARLASEEDVRRFQAEAEAAARLDHPGIVPIFEVGQFAGQHFYSMGLVEGGSLADLTSKGPLAPKRAAQYVAEIAEAVQYAHSRNIVHRDLKPANVLLDPAGHPKVTDFGLAKDVATDSGLTATGTVMGTPSYMAPEQAAGKSSEVGPLADVYSLGAVLYCLLTGRPPFVGSSTFEIIQQVLAREAESPRRVNSQVDLDISTICLKCLEKDATRRYPSAAHLREELGRYLAGEPIRARPISRVERGARWIARHPAPSAAAGLAGVAVFLLLLIGVFSWLWVEARSAQKSAEQAQDAAEIAQQAAEAARGELAVANGQLTRTNSELSGAKANLETANQKLDRSAYADQVMLAYNEFNGGNFAGALQLLEECRPNQRGSEWQHLNLRLRANQLVELTGHKLEIRNLAMSPDGSRLASASNDGTWRLWSVPEGELLHTETRPKAVGRVTFSPDGQRILTSDGETGVRLWAADDCRPIAALKDHFSGYGPLEFTPDGRLFHAIRMASPYTVTFWETETGRRSFSLGISAKQIVMANINPTGERLAWRDLDGNCQLWNLIDRKPLASVPVKLTIHALPCFSPDGQRVVLDDVENRLVLVCDSATGNSIHRLSIPSHEPAKHLGYSPDGRRLVAAYGKQFVIWDARSGKQIALHSVHTEEVKTLVFSPDGRRLFSAGGDRLVRVWDPQNGQLLATLVGHARGISSLTVSPDGALLATGSEEGQVRLWDLRADPYFESLGAAARETVAVTDDGARMAVAPYDSNVEIWSPAESKREVKCQGPANDINRLAFGEGNQRLAAGTYDGRLLIWDAQDGRLLSSRLTGDDVVDSIVCSPQGGRVATAGYQRPNIGDKIVRLWDLERPEPLATLSKLHSESGASVVMEFSPDGSKLAVVGGGSLVKNQGDAVQIWHARDGTLLASAVATTQNGHAEEVRCLAFSRDGTKLATGQAVYHVANAELVAHLSGQEFVIHDVAYNSEGTLLATASFDHNVHLWNPTDGKLVATLRGHRDQATWVTFSRDGKRLASTSSDQTVRLWDVPSGKPLAVLPTTTGSLRRVEFGPDDSFIIAKPLTGPPHLWHCIPSPMRQKTRRAAWHLDEALAAEQRRQWFAASFHLSRQLVVTPEDASLLARRGRAELEQGHVERGLADLQAARVRDVTNASLAYQHAMALLLAGREADHREQRAALLARHAKSDEVSALNVVAWLMAVLPWEQVDGATPPQLIEARRMADRVVAKNPDEPYFHGTFGSICYRCGDDTNACVNLENVLSRLNDRAPVSARLFLAMAKHRQGAGDEARQHLKLAISTIDNYLLAEADDTAQAGVVIPSWEVRLANRLLRAEAEALISKSSPE